MFIPFRIQKSEIYKLKCPVPLIMKKHEKQKSIYLEQLKTKLLSKDGILDGDALKQGILPVNGYFHVFISYSHKDESEAKRLANYLESYGVKCFLDSYYWGSADDLLKEIDIIWGQNEQKTAYSYQKRNYTTSLVHALLSMSIMQAIDHCDIGIFIESENSLKLNLSDITDFTLSPWIYEELNYMVSIQKRLPHWLNRRETKMFACESGTLVESQAPVEMKFTIPSDKLTQLFAGDILYTQGKGDEWMRNFYYEKFSETNYIIELDD